MSKLFRKLIAGSAAVLTLLPAAITAPGVTRFGRNAAAAPDDRHDDWLHVNENAEIVDMDGNPVWLTGVNWFGYNAGRQVFDGVWSKNMHSMLNQIADHGFNLLRVPMSTQILLQWKNKGPDSGGGVGEVTMMVNPYENPELTVGGGVDGAGQYELKYSFDIWNMAVDWCRENGIKIMIDIHSATTAAMGHQKPLWYDDNFSEDDWLEALEWFCDYYKDDDTIIAIDLKNEPHGKPEEGSFAKWDDSKDSNNWKYAAEKGAMACLKQNPNLLIMIEGTECYPDFEKGADWTTPCVDYAHYDEPSLVFGAWWGGNLRGVKDHPVDIGEYNKQIVYSPHDYGPLVWKQKWFYMDDDSKTFDRESLLDDYWRDTWAYLVEDKMYPLLMGEWGGFIDKEHDPTGENKHWMQELRDYMIDKRIHHTFWCFNENSGDTGGLVYDDFGKWDEEKYEFVKPSLWQTEDGKFISLDHKTPVGENGISLSEYYSGERVEHTTRAPLTTTTNGGPITTTTTTGSATTTTSTVTGSTTTSSVAETAVSVSTVTTTEPVTGTEIYTHPTYTFDQVVSYPSKTEYKSGEKLDFSGIKLTGKDKDDANYTKNYTADDVEEATVKSSGLKITITDKSGKNYTKKDFTSLPAGEYTISVTGNIGDYYMYNLCYDVDFSYKITVTGSATGTSGTNSGTKGDANCDDEVNMADAVIIMQSIANPDKYKLTAQGEKNADVEGNGDGITNKDALKIQRFKLNLISSL